MKKILILVLLFFGVYAYSQNPPCKANVVMNSLYNQFPEMKTQSDFVNTQIERARAQQRNYSIPAPGSITIPTVVYVVHNGTTTTNITDSQVQQQLVALNQKFNDTGIKFCLGGSVNNVNVPMKTASEVQTTKGIIHIQNSTLINHSSTNSQVLFNTAHSSVTPDKYMRIWVINSIDGLNSGVLGYAYYPGGNNYDGIVVRNNVFGNGTSNLLANYNQGETLVHEVGHYLGLRHTFEGGCQSPNNNPLLDNDFVADTPKVATANFNCVIGTNSCIESPESNDLIRNYMDYGNNVCSDSFTNGQKQRMIYQINQYRTNLVSKDNIIATGTCGSDNLLSAKISANKYSVCANNPLGVSFSALSAQSWSWNFGDGTSSILQNPTHVYTSAINSPYTVTLTVTGLVDNQIQTLVSTTQIFVSDCSNFAPNSDTYWHVANSKGLNFITGVAQFDTTFPQNNTSSFDTTSISDNNGNLLFYTGRNKLWNGQHQLISSEIICDGGNGLNPIIVPNPANANQYYLFSGSWHTQTSSNNYGLRYSIIQNNNGVISLNSINVPVTFPSGYSTVLDNAVTSSKGVTAVRKCNGDYWIITTICKNGHMYIVVYSLSAANGLTFHDDNDFDLGYSFTPPDYTTALCSLGARVIASPNGNKLFCGHRVFDFDKNSGEISNLRLLNLYSGGYNAIFSPDSKFLYTIGTIIPYGETRYIIQHDLNSPNLSAVPVALYYNSWPEIWPQGNVFQIGPDEKIYVKPFSTSTLGIIHQPNVLATQSNSNACLFLWNGPNATDIRSLPNFINAKQSTVYPTDLSKKISKYLIGCNRYKFFPNVCSTSFKWEFINTSNNNNTVTINETTPEFEFVTNGNYTIKLKNANNDELATTSLTVSTPVVTINGSSTACTTSYSQTNNSVVLSAGQSVTWTAIGGTITGLNTNASVNVNWLILPGQLTATVMNANGCISESTKTISDACPCDCLSDLELVRTGPTGIDSCDWYIINNSTDPRCSNLNLRNSWYIDFQSQGNGLVLSDRSCGSAVGVTVGLMNQTNSFSYCNVNLGTQNPESRLISDKTKTNSRDIFISPNPSTGLYNIRIDDFIGKVSMQVVDINGRVILNQINADFNNEETIDLSAFQSGLYILKVNTNNLNYTEKLIKN